MRSDLTAFLGYARKGPASQPVRVQSWREFVTAFGEPYEVGYLAPAVQASFENGGAVCWVVRVVDEDAAVVATWTSEPVTLSGDTYRWRISASFNGALSVHAQDANASGGTDATLPAVQRLRGPNRPMGPIGSGRLAAARNGRSG